jgi:hypothetical protein
MDNLTLSTHLVNGILQYLTTRPWAEVQGLIAEIQKQASEQGAQQAAPEVQPAEPAPKAE